ncbi:PfkB family carbohydrate kinase [Spirosoma luteum]|uniref:PfkB family carbohydrate kinase n=1 Tax=Spirosoma luteum TaxID=431553 RepID=UPI0003A71013|nr:PfkB family carbohydrate kinase [Spirosoma luteum]
MLDICTIGHISLDRVLTPQSVNYMPGGTSFYFSKALAHSAIKYGLLTAVAPQEHRIVDDLRAEGITVYTQPSRHTVYFENIYGDDQDDRDQNVLAKADPFSTVLIPDIKARIFHLGPLLADDIPVSLLADLSKRGLVSLDIQGYLRHLVKRKVVYRDWAHKRDMLPKVGILKVNNFEMEVLTGRTSAHEGARYLADLGVPEVVVTLGSKGSLIFNQGKFSRIPAFKPKTVVDATGCGDTYMAGYLLKRVQGAGIEEAGEFGAAMATVKIGAFGPFSGSHALVTQLLGQVV